MWEGGGEGGGDRQHQGGALKEEEELEDCATHNWKPTWSANPLAV